MSGGICHLVGAGPGDPGLLTLRADEVLRQADVVVYDSLVNEELLRRCRPECERIFAGKRAERHEKSQQEINELLVRLCREGKHVVRLKGGDPLVFARGGEEIEAVDRAGCRFEIVPGVSAGTAVPAYAGIPLTHRECSSSVLFVTGHEREAEEGARTGVNWKAAAELGGTLVVFMASRHLAGVLERLRGHGVAESTPAAFIQWGTTTEQRSAAGTVGTLAAEVAVRGLGPPALLVVGPTVALRERLRWFEERPLFGRRVVVTRAAEQAGKLAELLRQRGAEVLELPLLRIVPREVDWARAGGLENYRWLVFTSPNGVRCFFDALLRRGDVRELKGVKIAAVGPSTAREVESYHVGVDFIPSVYQAKHLALEWPDPGAGRVLFAAGVQAGPAVEEGLTRSGCQVVRIHVYDTEEGVDREAPGYGGFAAHGADWVVFCSPSAVRTYAKLPESLRAGGRRIASMGPVTSAGLRSAGLSVDAEPAESTLEALVEAIAAVEKGRA